MYIRVELSNDIVLPATGFFINKSNGYSITEKPYIITAGHLFAPNNIDIRSSIAETFLYVNYEDQDCMEDFERRGVYAGGFDIVSIGSSFNVNAQSSSYVHNEDFALLRSENLVSQHAVNNVLYAGWDRSFNYEGSSGYAYIGHPMDDVKTVNTYSGNGQVNSLGDYFKIYNSTGICERGFSGSPVFWGSPGLGNVKAVGWALSTMSAVACGDENQVTRCGMFSDLFLNFDVQNILNPVLKYSQSSWQPTTEALPAHCSNCVQDGDETGIDCGGSCQPCGMADELVLNTYADIYGRTEFNSRFALSVDGGSEPLEFSDNDYVLTSGETVTLKSFKVVDGANFKAQVIPSQRYEAMQGCQPACISVSEIVGESPCGYFPYIIADIAFVSSYRYSIYNRSGGIVLSRTSWYSSNINEEIVLWDGSDVNPGNFTILFEYYDCQGNHNIEPYNIYAFALKSQKIEVIDEIGTTFNEEVLIYPNPAKDELSIYVDDSLSYNSYDVSVFEINGKMLKQKMMNGRYNNLDISDFHSGSYVLKITTANKTFTKRFIKK